MLTLPGITLQSILILQPRSAALVLKLYHLMAGCFIFSGLQPPPVSYSLICLSVLSSTVHICKTSSARQSCLPSEFYNQASPSNQTIKTNTHNLRTYKRGNSYSFPYSTLNTSTWKWNFTWIHSVVQLIENLVQVSFLNPSQVLYPADLAPLVNLTVTRERFLKAAKTPQNYSDFIPVTIYFYLLTNLFAQSINFHMQCFLE